MPEHGQSGAYVASTVPVSFSNRRAGPKFFHRSTDPSASRYACSCVMSGGSHTRSVLTSAVMLNASPETS